MKVTDITGVKFSRLTAIKQVGVNKHRKALWLCRCDCGTETVVIGCGLRSGMTKSCGCLRVDSPGNRTHGLSATKLHAVWRSLRNRCNNPRCRQYPDYGGRGIRCDARWDDFALFYADVIPTYYPGALLDRTDNDGNYAPGNFRWTDRATQNANTRSNVHYTVDGQVVIQRDASRILGVTYWTLSAWRKRGMSDEQIEAYAISPNRPKRTMV